MKKIFYLIPVIMVLACSISFSIFNSVYRKDKPVVQTVEAQAKETSANALPTVSISDSDDNLTITKGQAVTPVIAVKIPAPDTYDKKVVATPVSRGAGSADIYKYPQLSKVNGSFGQFRYKDLSGGRIEVDPQWIAENIVTITLPGLNRSVQVNKGAADNFIQAFNYIKNGTATINGKQVPLLSLIDTMDGTFVTRHVNWNSAKGLSNHSWGSAIDINADYHFRYVDPTQDPNDPNVILWEKAFKPAGFSWGNSYSDSMHYELLK
jgi:hypothetical protein